MHTKYDWYKEASPRARALMFVVDVFKVVPYEIIVIGIFKIRSKKLPQPLHYVSAKIDPTDKLPCLACVLKKINCKK